MVLPIVKLYQIHLFATMVCIEISMKYLNNLEGYINILLIKVVSVKYNCRTYTIS